MNALTDGFGGSMSGTHLLALLTVVLAVVVVLVLAAALIVVPQEPGADVRRASRRSPPRSTASRRQHLRPLEGSVKAINAQFDIILGALPGIASKAAIVAERRPRVTLWWIGTIVLLVVIFPVVVYLLHGVLSAARSIVPSVREDRDGRRRRGRRTSTPPRSC